jgi:hypothetical protein
MQGAGGQFETPAVKIGKTPPVYGKPLEHLYILPLPGQVSTGKQSAQSSAYYRNSHSHSSMAFTGQ